MKITETERLELRSKLTEAIGPTNTRVLMEALPPVDYDQLATKADLTTGLAVLEQTLRGEISDLRGEFAGLRGEFAGLRGEFAELRGDMTGLRGEVQESIGQLALENARQMRTIVIANLGSLLAFAALLLGLG